jgi:hypothetical protein
VIHLKRKKIKSWFVDIVCHQRFISENWEVAVVSFQEPSGKDDESDFGLRLGPHSL